MIQPKFCKAKEVKEALGGAIAESTLYGMARRREIPCYTIGKAGVRFIVEEVISALRRPAKNITQ